MTNAPLPPDGSSSGTRGAGLSRRRFLWGCGLLAPMAALGGTWAYRRSQTAPAPRAPTASSSADAAPHVRQAVWAAAAGRCAQARTEADAALAASPENARALFILACVALEEGDAREAERAIARLKLRVPERQEPLLLERLLAHRQRVPASGWAQAFREAWLELDRPDFARTHLLAGAPLDTQGGEVSEEVWLGTKSLPARLLLTLASRPVPPSRARWLLEQMPELEDPAMLLAVSNVLSVEELPKRLRAQAASTLRQRLPSLAKAHPRSMQLQLLAWSVEAHEDSPFSPRELESLEPLLSLPVWRESSFFDVFVEARHHLRVAGLSDASWLAFEVALLSTTDPGQRLLRKKASATRSHLFPRARERLGRVVHAIGARLAEQPTLLEHMLGLSMRRDGAEDMQAEAEMVRTDALLDEAHAAEAGWRKAAFHHWPLRSLSEELWEASARDEMALLRTFREPVASP